MDLLFTLTKYGGTVLLLGFLLVTVWKLLSGEIVLDGLLDDKQGRSSFSPGRAQLLIFTLLVAGKYLLAVIQNPHRDSLPGLPVELVALLGGSQAVYLGGKAWSKFSPVFKKLK